MSIINDFLKVLSVSSTIEAEENYTYYNSKHLIDISHDRDQLIYVLPVLIGNVADQVIDFTITIKTSTPTRINENFCRNIEEKVNEFEEQLSLEEKPTIEAEIRIQKKPGCIFDINAYVKYLGALTIQESMEKLSAFKVGNKSSIKFKVWHDFDVQNTGAFIFESVYPDHTEAEEKNILIDAQSKIEKRDQCAHFANASLINLVPEDLDYKKLQHPELKKYFEKLYCASLLIFLSDYSAIEKNTLDYKLKGYKLISDSVDFSKINNVGLSEMTEIYSWVYTDGNFADKIGLARNIISIHLGSNSLLSLQSGAFNSVRSGYDLYLKDNVKQYIEVKNKIVEFIQSQSDKASDMTKNMFSMFKTGIWAFTTFFISVFLLRVVGKGENSVAIDSEVYTVSCLLISFSFIYMFIACVEINSDKKRLLQKYDEVKQRYSDLLDAKDLDAILNVEKEKECQEEYINNKRNSYVGFWFLINALLSAVVSWLRFCPQ
ncbi:hypothetical protein [Cobetia amphilecti]|uniref:hypothetical protein n=1 Tax=Cobetia amphilecti TaxID=1055104 RepID=UPI001C09ACC1|nr:hypothetical protein [Cobetia amphilecti]MBU3007313.1 hypothetical protein [Cobetia amphilecti]